MRTKKEFSFNEEEQAEAILLEGFQDGLIDYSKMYLIAKYFRETNGFGAIRLERELIRFCKEQNPNFNPVVEAENIKKWVRSALNYNLRKVSAVGITASEINLLRTIDSDKDRKILFVILVLSKALKQRNSRQKKTEFKTSLNCYIHYNNFLNIIRLSHISGFTEIDLANMLHEYKNFFTFYNPEMELIRVEYADMIQKEILFITDLSNMLEYYELLFGKKKPAAFCSDCHKPIIKNSNKQKRCKECAAVYRKEQKKLWIRNSRLRVDK